MTGSVANYGNNTVTVRTSLYPRITSQGSLSPWQNSSASSSMSEEGSQQRGMTGCMATLPLEEGKSTCLTMVRELSTTQRTASRADDAGGAWIYVTKKMIAGILASLDVRRSRGNHVVVGLCSPRDNCHTTPLNHLSRIVSREREEHYRPNDAIQNVKTATPAVLDALY